MNRSILLKVPSKSKYFELVKSTILELAHEIHFDKKDISALVEATQELFTNAIAHAYRESEGFIEVVFHPFIYGMRIDVHDWGMPMAANKYSSVPINLEEDKGFNHIYKLVDKFEYANLGKNGKKFSIIKYVRHNLYEKTQEKFAKEENLQHVPKNTTISVRIFQPGDEEAIAKLIFQNYGYSYIKESFYYPKKIREQQGSKLFSIIALDIAKKKIVGHFALVKMPGSNIAEIGIVVVNPRYKGLGIMNRMFDALITYAKELRFDAIFGEAIMFHIFSQKSNASHGFSESALLLGRSPEDVTIEHNTLTQKKLRGSVLVAYKIFHYPVQQLTLPEIYKDKILETYKRSNLHVKIVSNPVQEIKEHVQLYYTYEPLMNIATIIIDHYGKHFKYKFLLLLSQLRAKHCDMIYAEINLNNLPQIDKVVSILNDRGFFYAGVLFLKHKNQDYLCLQNKHSIHIGKKNLVCYSDFCKKLLTYIHMDEQRIKQNKIK